MIIANLILICLLIAFSAFFVASEFAIVRVRPTRIEQLIAEGNSNAETAKKIIVNMDGYLSACQLGITMTSLGLGWLGEPTVLKLILPVLHKLAISPTLSHIVAFIISFSVITYINVVVGELFPKSIAIQQTEKVTLLFAKPLRLFYKGMYPFIWILNNASRLVARLYGVKNPRSGEPAHSEEELQLVLAESYKNGEITTSEFRYVNNIFEFDNRVANEIMVPRIEMVTLCEDLNLEEVLQIIQTERYSRYPITKNDDKDNIIGFVHIKQLLSDFIKNKNMEEKPLKSYIQPIIHVMEFIPIQHILRRMQKERINIAVLHDEFGGTAGLISVEDILEEIVGEIRDEFDINELPNIQKVNDHHYIFDSKLLLDEVNNILPIHIEHDSIHTIGGWVLSQNPDLQKGQSILYDHFEFKAVKMVNHHVSSIEVKEIIAKQAK
ncbi:hemolysin family protein [Niallia sp. 03133]|uniref:hemolysin family protein n=1 Tax=Niallia sp. 03133 TaxID=3458060 RepID=UPI0040444406